MGCPGDCDGPAKFWAAILMGNECFGVGGITAAMTIDGGPDAAMRALTWGAEAGEGVAAAAALIHRSVCRFPRRFQSYLLSRLTLRCPFLKKGIAAGFLKPGRC